MVTVVLSATHVPLSRHNFLNLSYQKTSGEDEDIDDKEDCCVPRRCDSSESSDTDSIGSTSDAEC